MAKSSSISAMIKGFMQQETLTASNFERGRYFLQENASAIS